jgi:hypothetical protein
MELLGFNKWNQVNESAELVYYQFDFKDPKESLNERIDMAVKSIEAECQKLFPSYTTLVEVKDDIVITFTLKEDDFSLFSDTGAATPFTSSAGVNAKFTGIREIAIKALDRITTLFKKPITDQEITVLVISRNIDDTINHAANAMATKMSYVWRSTPPEIEIPLESKLDEITFGKGDRFQFNETLNTYLKYSYFKEYFKAALVGKVKPSYNSIEDIKQILEIKADGKSVTESIEEVKKVLPILRKLYYESEVNRYESKVASDLFAKAITHLISQFGGTSELFKALNELSKAGKSPYYLL